MSVRNFRALLEERWSQGKFVCPGLDSDFEKIPVSASAYDDKTLGVGATIVNFNSQIVQETHDLAGAFKLNIAFYEEQGAEGVSALQWSIKNIHHIAPAVPVILDYKRGDIGNSNKGYIKSAFDYYQADAVTVHPYLGMEAMRPFLDCKDKGIFVLCRTSNPGASEFQDLLVDGVPLYQVVARHVAEKWNANGNCGVVVGATYPEELRQVRAIIGDMPVIIPGVGFQQKGTSLEQQFEQTVTAGKDSRRRGMIINNSRGIIFASKGTDYPQAARRVTQQCHDLITQFR